MLEYKTVTCMLSLSIESLANEFAREGWRLINVTKTWNSDYVLTFEREKR